MESRINKPYRPSNGTEGMIFMSNFCDHCIYENGDNVMCEIITLTMGLGIEDKGYPEEWQYNDNGKPTCTKYVKFDWGRDDDGNWIMPPEPPTDDPNQLCLPFIFDELGIKKVKEKQLV